MFRLCFYQTRSAWSVDQGSNKNHSPAYNFAPTVTKFCVMWEGLSLPHGTKFGNCRCKIVDSRAFPSWSLIHGLRWSGLIKAEPGFHVLHVTSLRDMLKTHDSSHVIVIKSRQPLQMTTNYSLYLPNNLAFHTLKPVLYIDLSHGLSNYLILWILFYEC